MVALLAASLLIGIAGGAISAEAGFHATMGGAGGVLLLNKITGAVDGLITFYPHIIVASICAGLTGLLLAGIGTALRRSERRCC